MAVLSDVSAKYLLPTGVPLTGWSFGVLGDGELGVAPERMQGNNPVFTADQGGNAFVSNKVYRFIGYHDDLAPTGQFGQVKWDDNGNPVPLSDAEDGNLQAGADTGYKLFDDLLGLGRYKGPNTQAMLTNGWAYYYDPDSTATPDNLFYIASAKGGNWVLITDIRVPISWFGVRSGRNLTNNQRTANTVALQKAVDSGRALKAHGKIYEFNGTVNCLNKPLNIEGIRWETHFVQCADHDLIFLNHTDADHRVYIKDILFGADGAFTSGVALNLNHYNVQPANDPVHASPFVEISGCMIIGYDAYTGGATQHWKTGINWTAPNGFILEKCWIQGKDGELGSGTKGIIINTARAAVDCRIDKVFIGLVEVGIDFTATNYPGLEGIHVTNSTIVGVQDGIRIYSLGYKAPGWIIEDCHIKAARFNLYAYNVGQGFVSNCYFYNQGNVNAGVLQDSTFIALVACNDWTIHDNKFIITLEVPEGSTPNPVYGIIINSPFANNKAVANRVFDNYFASLSGVTDTPAVWCQGLNAVLNRVERNDSENFRHRDTWKQDSDENRFQNNWPKDYVDALRIIHPRIMDGEPLGSRKLVIDVAFGYRSGKFNVVWKDDTPGDIYQIRLEPGVEADLELIGVGRRIVYNDGTGGIYLKDEQDLVTTSYRTLLTVKGDNDYSAYEKSRRKKTVLPDSIVRALVPIPGDPDGGLRLDLSDGIPAQKVDIPVYPLGPLKQVWMPSGVGARVNVEFLGTGRTIVHNPGMGGIYLGPQVNHTTSFDRELFTFQAMNNLSAEEVCRRLNAEIVTTPTTPTTPDPTNQTYVTADVDSEWTTNATVVSNYIDGLTSAIKGVTNTYALRDNIYGGGTQPHNTPVYWYFVSNPYGSAVTIDSATGVLLSTYQLNSSGGLQGTVTIGAKTSAVGTILAKLDVGLYASAVTTNKPPVVLNPFPDILVTKPETDTYFFPYNQFYDPDDGWTRTSVTLTNGDPLPAWMVYYPSIGRLDIVASQTTFIEAAIRVTATDTIGQTAYDDIHVTVDRGRVDVQTSFPWSHGVQFDQALDLPDGENWIGFVTPNGGHWTQKNGKWSQDSSSVGADSYTSVVTENDSFHPLDSTECTALVMPVSFTDGVESTRFGVGIRHHTDGTGGYSFMLYGNTTQVHFLDDQREHGPYFTYNWQAGQRYWMRIQYQETGTTTATVRAKIWKPTENEPTTWAFEWTGRARRSGYPALIGGACLTSGQASKCYFLSEWDYKVS